MAGFFGQKQYTVTHDCKRCGDCCRVDGYVFISGTDERRIREYVGAGKKEFRDRFTDWFFLLGRVLKLDAEGCCFLVDSRCMIYEVRPKQCRTFPFWPRVMRSKKELLHVMSYCRGTGFKEAEGR